MCQIFGEFAYKSENMTPFELADEAERILSKIFPKVVLPKAIGCSHSKWSTDPLIRGSWSYIDIKDKAIDTKGSIYTDMDHLDGNLYFFKFSENSIFNLSLLYFG